jgi:cysteine-rich repeat protein
VRPVRLLLLLLPACSEVQIEPDEPSPSSVTAGSSASSTSAGSSSTSSSSTSSGAGGNGGAGGEEPLCGNANLDASEQCDDGNADDGDGCSSDCLVQCEKNDPLDPHEAVFQDPDTNHCYRWAGGLAPEGCGVAMFFSAQGDCTAWGGDLAALSTLEERDAVVAAGLVPINALDVFLGGVDMSGQGGWAWLNGEPWTYQLGAPPWQPGEPVGGTFLEMYAAGQFNADVDGSACGWVCERPPAGAD